MTCGIALLVYLAAVSMIATFLPGGEWVFRSWVFVFPACGLGLNLVLCSLRRFPELVRRGRAEFVLGGEPTRIEQGSFAVVPIAARMGCGADDIFRAFRFQVREKRQIGEAMWSYGCRRVYGIWGSWVCHLGMLIVLIGVVLGQFLVQNAYVYGVPGQSKSIQGTGLNLEIVSFHEALWEDGSARQYISEVVVTDAATGQFVSGSIEVNQPMEAFGLNLLQSGSGWAVTMDIYQGLMKVGEAVLCEGEIIEMAMGGLQLALEPEEAADKAEVTCLFYYNGELSERRRVPIGQTTAEGGYEFVFRNPQKYTMIQVVSDPTGGVVFGGALLLLAGAFVAFQCRPQELWVKEERGTVTVYGRSRRDGGRFAAFVRESLRGL